MELRSVDFSPEPEYPVIREHFWKRPCFKKKLAISLVSLVGFGGMVAAGVETAAAVDRLMAPKNVFKFPAMTPVRMLLGKMKGPSLPAAPLQPRAGSSSTAGIEKAESE